MLALTIAMGAVSVWSLRGVVASKDQIITGRAVSLTEAERLRAGLLRQMASIRGFLLTGNERHLVIVRETRDEVSATLPRLQRLSSDSTSGQMLAQIERAIADHRASVDNAIALRKGGASISETTHTFDESLLPKALALEQQLDALVSREQGLLDEDRRKSTAVATSAITLVTAIALVTTLVAATLVVLLTRVLSRQIGSAVQHVQSSSAELQASANQQATGAKEQASAMTEISTTIGELLATSKQIAESAQRVAQIAGETAAGARAGDQLLQEAQDTGGSIKSQVDIIVTHMLDLGRQSQQIGGILEIINELAEQTNILAINPTIEAAGAGEAGKRFAVVADEIRKLADRVAGSTREIRGLIDVIRAAVNNTVMATEGGSKAVDAGTRQFAEATSAFRQIAGLVVTTSEAAREIELSTKQQATAVEQVRVAIANAAQATREAEASSSQVLQTASELATLSTDLTRLIQAHANA